MLKFIVGVGTCLIVSACQAPSPEAYKLINVSPEVREQRFASLPVDSQIAVFPELMRSITPRPIGLSVTIARGGAQSGRKVVSAMAATEDFRDKVNLLKVLDISKELGTYDVCNDDSSLKLILPDQRSKGDGNWRLQYALDLIGMCLSSRSEAKLDKTHASPISTG